MARLARSYFYPSLSLSPFFLFNSQLANDSHLYIYFSPPLVPLIVKTIPHSNCPTILLEEEEEEKRKAKARKNFEGRGSRLSEKKLTKISNARFAKEREERNYSLHKHKSGVKLVRLIKQK